MGVSEDGSDSTTEVCMLCGAKQLRAETRDLYEVRACVNCQAALSQRRQAAFLVDCVLFFFRDGFWGMSPGKWLCDVQVLDEITLRPAGFRASFKRNLVFLLSWIAVIFVAIEVRGGRRWGDRWAGTVVIWRRYADRLPRERPFTICRHCGYDLTGKVSGVCPECSAVIPDHDRKAIAAKGL